MNYIFLFLLTLIPQVSFAADTSNTQITSLLTAMFGSLVTSGQDNPIAAGIGALNGIVLIVGGLLVAYTIVVGTIGTAQEGEMMGKKFSSIWVPIRTALGTAFILPIFSGGYCMMQVLVMWIIMQGVNLGGTAWSGYVNNYSGNMIKVSENVNTSFKSYGYNIFKSYVCIESAQNIIYQLNQPNLRTSIKRTEYQNSILFEFGFNEEFGFKQDSCGVIEIPKPKNMTKEQELALSKYMSDDYMKSVLKGVLIEKAHFDNVNNLFQGMQGLAKNLVKSGHAVSINEIDSVIANYDAKIRAAVKEELKVLENSPNLNEKNNATDWLLAGAYYMRAFWGKEVIENAINNFGVATGYGSFDNKVFNEKYDLYNRLVEESLAGNSVSDIRVKLGVDENKWKSISKLDAERIVKKNVFSEINSSNWIIEENEHPLMTMQRFGKWLTQMGNSAVGDGVGLMFGNQSVSSAVQTILFIFAIPMIIVGGILEYILPMLPFVFWIGIISSWAILSLSTIIFSPIWAVLHMNPNGEDLVGYGGQGYKVVLLMMIRPIVNIMGLIASFVLIEFLGKFINKIFYPIIIAIQSSDKIFIMLTGLIFVAIIYAITMYVLIRTLFIMNKEMPNNLLNWFNSANMTQISNTTNQNNNTQASQPISTIQNMVQNISSRFFDGAKNTMNTNTSDMKSHRSDNVIKGNMKEEKKKAEIENELGEGSYSLVKYASNGGTNKMGELSAQKAVRGKVNGLGGKGTTESLGFLKQLNDAIESEMKKMQGEQAGWQNLFEKVSKNTLNKEFGEQTGEVLSRVGGSGVDENGKTKQSFFSDEYNDGVMSYYKKSVELQNEGLSLDDVRKLFEKANKKIMALYIKSGDSVKNGGKKTMAQFMKEELEKLEK